MKTKAAVVYETGKPIEIEELDLDGPRDGEVLIRYEYAGLCHSDVHIAHGDLEARLPMVLGHEGAGVIEEVGPGVTRVAAGDHVVCSFIPNCGTCRYCSTGMQSVCDMGATILEGYLPGERFPITGPKGDYGAMCMLGTFSQYGVIHQNSAVKVDDDLPLDKAVLVGCGVPTGWGSAVNTANVRAGDTVAVFGIGGIGINAVQGARYAGAKNVVAVDPLENKREKAMELGATHAFATAEEAIDTISQLTRGQMAESAILTPGLLTAEIVTSGFNAVGQGRHGRADRPAQVRRDQHPAARHGALAVAEDACAAASSATATRRSTSRGSSVSTSPATSSWTRSSPGRTPSSRSTRATTTCSPARTSAASSCTSTRPECRSRSRPSGAAGSGSCSWPRSTAARTSSWRVRPAPARARCCGRWPPPGRCRSTSSRATPS